LVVLYHKGKKVLVQSHTKVVTEYTLLHHLTMQSTLPHRPAFNKPKTLCWYSRPLFWFWIYIHRNYVNIFYFYFAIISVTKNYMLNYIMVINEKNLEGSGRGLNKVVFRNLPGGARTMYHPRTSRNQK
jgi:hypothetical protein